MKNSSQSYWLVERSTPLWHSASSSQHKSRQRRGCCRRLLWVQPRFLSEPTGEGGGEGEREGGWDGRRRESSDSADSIQRTLASTLNTETGFKRVKSWKKDGLFFQQWQIYIYIYIKKKGTQSLGGAEAADWSDVDDQMLNQLLPSLSGLESIQLPAREPWFSNTGQGWRVSEAATRSLTPFGARQFITASLIQQLKTVLLLCQSGGGRRKKKRSF